MTVTNIYTPFFDFISFRKEKKGWKAILVTNKMELSCEFFLSLFMLILATIKGKMTLKENATELLEVSFKEGFRMGEAIVDYTVLEIVARPLLMVEEYPSVASDGITVSLKPGIAPWYVVGPVASIRGGVYSWSVGGIAPCINHMVRITIMGVDGSKAVVHYGGEVGGVSIDTIARTGYRPKPPTDLTIVQTGGKVVVGWEPSLCASLYDITYTRVGGGRTVSRQVMAGEGTTAELQEGIETCSEYEVKVAAVTGDEYSDEVTAVFVTPPVVTAVERLDPVIIPTVSGVTAKWRGGAILPCINQYQVTLCRGERESNCIESRKLVLDNSLMFLVFSSTIPLVQCSPYLLHIKPLFKTKNLYKKEFKFRTLSPSIGSLTSLITSVEASLGPDEMVTVQWSNVPCARQYVLYQKESSSWSRIAVTSNNTHQYRPGYCGEYQYGVTVTVESQESDIVESSNTVVTSLDYSSPYTTPNLAMVVTHDKATLSWDYQQCIDSYRVMACHGREEECYEEQVYPDQTTLNNITLTLTNLSPCSPYTVYIYPHTLGREVGPDRREFRTSDPPPTPPDTIIVELDSLTNKVVITWGEVDCATQYNIHQLLHHSHTVTQWAYDSLHNLSVSLADPEPCATYRYVQLKTVVA